MHAQNELIFNYDGHFSRVLDSLGSTSSSDYVLNYCFSLRNPPYDSKQNSLRTEQYALISTYTFSALHKSSHTPILLGDNCFKFMDNAK